MLDTVILTLQRGSYRVFSPQMFYPNAIILEGRGSYLVRCVNNPTAQDKKDGIYKPRLTLVKRMTKNGTEIPLKIEFSVPKILYGNNVDEVTPSDFEAIARALRKKVLEMGIYVDIENIRRAKVSAFHVSKNIPLENGYTSKFVIAEIAKINVTKKMDLNKDSFRNNGSSLQFYTNSHSMVIYDKIADIRKTEKRAIDKDQNSVQLSLLDKLQNIKMQELLRIEVRLAKKVKMNSVLRQHGLLENPTFRDLFNAELCQKILISYWEQIIANENLFLFDIETNWNDALRNIFRNNPTLHAKEAIYLIGLSAISNEGVREARSIVEQYTSTRTWYRIANDLSTLNNLSNKNYHGWVNQIQDSLRQYKAYKQSDNPP